MAEEEGGPPILRRLDPARVLGTVNRLAEITQSLQRIEDARLGYIYGAHWKEIFHAVKLYEHLKQVSIILLF